MCPAENDSNKNSAPDAAAAGPSEHFGKSALEILPGLDELFADPQVRKCVGDLIAGAARRANTSKS